MFAEKLTKVDIAGYVQDVICGQDYEVTTNIIKEKVYDENGDLDCISVDFYAVDTKTDIEHHWIESIVDFEDDDDHLKFFIKKFGLPYILDYKSFLKDLPVSNSEKMERLKQVNDIFYGNMAKSGQKTINEFEEAEITR